MKLPFLHLLRREPAPVHEVVPGRYAALGRAAMRAANLREVRRDHEPRADIAAELDEQARDLRKLARRAGIPTPNGATAHD